MTAIPDTKSRGALVYLWDADYPWDVRAEKTCVSCTRAGYDVHIVARNRAWRALEEQLAEGTVHRMRPWRWAGRRGDSLLSFPAFMSPRWLRHLADVVRRVRPTVILVRDLPLCPTAIWIGARYGVPVVLDMAENYPAMMRKNFEAGRHRLADYVVRNPALVAAVERYCLPRLARIIVVVEENVARLERLGVPAERISLVSNTPPMALIEARPATRAGDGGGAITLVYVGILELPRGISELLQAVRLLRGTPQPVRAVIIGKGRDASILQDEATALGLTPAEVTFVGHVPSRDDVRATVRGADVGVLPHHANEAWNTTIPNKLFDYMAAELPVITSDVIPFARIVRETGAGIVFKSRDPASLASAIRTLFDGARRRAYGAAGLAAVRSRYNWEYDAHVLVGALAQATSEVVVDGDLLAAAPGAPR
jgi:glycosyltransferase involved in cell wall biosynthesis